MSGQSIAGERSTEVARLRCPHCHVYLDGPGSRLVDGQCPECGGAFRVEPASSVADYKRIGRYELRRPIGRGSFGVVYLAYDPVLNREVAVKVPRPGTLAGREDVHLFLREARHAARLEHPQIVRIYDCGESEQGAYIVAEYVPHPTLKDLLEIRRVLECRAAADLVASLAETLAFAHQAGVVHRDLKPSNVLWDGTGVPRILDFGLARQLDTTVTVTEDGLVMGTPAYMSPEQATGRSQEADARSDVYSLGVILFELLTGERPFTGNGSAILRKVAEDDAPSPRDRNERLPRDLETIVLRCLEKPPDRRFATASELAADLRRFLRHEPILSRPISTTERAWRWCRRHPSIVWPSVAIVVGLVVALGAAMNGWRVERAARERVAASRDEAMRYLVRAREATDASLTGASRALRYVPGSTEFQQRLLQLAVRQYESFAMRESSDPDINLELGRALYRLGEVHVQLRQYAEASDRYRQAAATFELLAESADRHEVAVVESATVAVKQGLLAERESDGIVADNRYSAAIQKLSAIAPPRDPELVKRWTQTLATAYILQAESAFRRHDLPSALSNLEQAQRAIDRFPATPDPDLLATRISLLTTWGDLLGERGETASSIAKFELAAKHVRELLRLNPDDPDYLVWEGQLAESLAFAWRRTGDRAREASAWQAALTAFQRHNQRFPESGEIALRLAIARCETGAMLRDLGDSAGAIPFFEQALATFQQPRAGQTVADSVIEDERATILAHSGLARAEVGDLPRGERELTESLAILAARRAARPNDLECRARWIAAQVYLARLLAAGDKLPDARRALEAALVVGDDPQTPRGANARLDSALFHARSRCVDWMTDASDSARRDAALEAAIAWSASLSETSAADDLAAAADFLTLSPLAPSNQLDAAAKCVERLLQLCPTNPDHHRRLAAVRFRRQDWPGCRTALEQAKQLRGHWIDQDCYWSAMCHTRQGDRSSAERDWQTGETWRTDHRPLHADSRRLARDAELLLQEKTEVPPK